MLYVIKLMVSAAMIVLVSEVSKKFPGLGGLLASLPLTSLLGILWIYGETRDLEKIAAHSTSVFWYVLPSLPMFLVLPWMLRLKVPFGWSMLLCCLLTMGLYTLTMLVLKRFGLAI